MEFKRCVFTLVLFSLASGPVASRIYPVEDARETYKKLGYGVFGLAEQGNPEAQESVASMYFHGQGVPVDYTKALFWAEKAARQGNAGRVACRWPI